MEGGWLFGGGEGASISLHGAFSSPKIAPLWLHEKKCLAEMMRLSKPASGAGAVGDIAMTPDGAEWATVEGWKYKCKLVPVDFGGVFVVKACQGTEWPPLAYVLESSMRKTSDYHIVPVLHSAVAWMANTVKQKLTKQNTPETVRARFSRLLKPGIAELEHALSHTCRDRELLAEALTHGSAPLQSGMPSGARLALVGDAAMQAFLGEKLWQCASFPTAATGYKRTLATHTFAAPRGENAWEASAHGKAEIDETPCSSPKDMRCKLLVCCNHMAYARTCVLLGISRMVFQYSEVLQRSLDQFTGLVKRVQGWRELVGHTAPPKALGDAFLAYVGTVLLDSHFSNAA